MSQWFHSVHRKQEVIRSDSAKWPSSYNRLLALAVRALPVTCVSRRGRNGLNTYMRHSDRTVTFSVCCKLEFLHLAYIQTSFFTVMRFSCSSSTLCFCCLQNDLRPVWGRGPGIFMSYFIDPHRANSSTTSEQISRTEHRVVHCTQ